MASPCDDLDVYGVQSNFVFKKSKKNQQMFSIFLFPNYFFFQLKIMLSKKFGQFFVTDTQTHRQLILYINHHHQVADFTKPFMSLGISIMIKEPVKVNLLASSQALVFIVVYFRSSQGPLDAIFLPLLTIVKS